ncbi:hypothetical protein MBLNU457_5880t1 [Dothideomycetes sp. NU457]
MYVRALYDYDADDRTSLSFRAGDIIQVITQLESGWWDGVIHGVRGWFPSNYCAVVPGPGQDTADIGGHGTEEEESEDDFAGMSASTGHIPQQDGEEAAFWIPQATADGRLFYFNTMTGVSTMELPLETPSSVDETGPRDRTNVYIPDHTRPPAELLVGGHIQNEETDYESASEAENGYMSASNHSFPRKRGSLGMSSATSMESLSQSPMSRLRGATDAIQPSFSVANHANPANGTTATSFANNPVGISPSGLVGRGYFDDTQAVQLTWNTLVEDMRRSVQRYKEAINNNERAEFVRRAEDISDHLRLLLAAGSGTTDNHSGNPSIISTNKALYPHFREMMSSFSKLVLSSHFAAADFTTPESFTKCLQEAEGLLHGVYGFVEIARQQRGEEIPRLTPGFISGSRSGGSWQNNGLKVQDLTASLPIMLKDDFEGHVDFSLRLNASVLERMEDMKKTINSNLRRLDDFLILRDKLITAKKHRIVGDNVCGEADRIVESCRPYMSAVESVNLSPFGSDLQNPQLDDFSMQKQRFYDSTLDLVMACQAVTAPLADEWSGKRDNSLEDRLNHVRMSSRELERSATQLQFSVQLLAEIMPVDANLSREDSRAEPVSLVQQRNKIADIGTPRSFSSVDAMGVGIQTNSGPNSKVQRFFGEVPVPLAQPRETEDEPSFLGLDHEGEIAYDSKTTPPQLRGGTLVGLVEQLTRHDRLDSPFNNTFLLTYQSFTTATELFEMLVKRWCIQPPAGLSAADIQRWTDKKQKPIRFRVVNILKSWFDNYWMEGTEEAAQALMHRVYTFAKETVTSTSTPGAGPLMTAIEQRMRGQDASNKRLVLTTSGSTPAPLIPKNIKKLKFLDIDPLEFARQLTIIESRLYCKIKPTECLNKTWQKKLAEGEADPASNVKALILHSNQLTNWVAQMILTQADVKRRQVVIKQFVSIADKCRALNNFSTLTSIISALGTAPIHRLSRTWSQVNQRTIATLESMRKLMGSTKNFLEYRETLHRANPPCIPFFGVYLTDLTFIEDGIPSIIKKTDLINFAKRAKTAEVISDIQQYQNVPYQLQPVPELQDYILKNMQTAGDVHEMYERSLQVEPREREDEKIARLLSESGFL